MFSFIPNHSPNFELYVGDAGFNYSIRTWVKPRGVKFISFIVVGSGGGGGRPSSAATTNCGGGGAPGAVTTAIFPAALLPDVLFLYMGPAGTGSSSVGFNGNPGTSSIVMVSELQFTLDTYLMFAAGGAGGIGNGGTATAAATAFSSNFTAYSSLGVWSSLPGYSSVITTNDIIRQNYGRVSPGANGGQATLPGRSIITDATRPTVFPNLDGGAATGARGLDGVWYPDLLMGTGGSGGGGNSGASAGGRGGDGAPGCGGGGGGNSGSTLGTTGNGGNGGPGFIAISYW